jgi:CheY-like chemotaxis protein
MQQTSQESVNILVVDDDPACRKLMTMALGESSFDCAGIETAESIEQTLELLRSQRFDIVLLDLNLPGSYGRQTLETVSKAQPTAAIVVVSGLDGDNLEALGIGEQAQGCLSKGKFDTVTLERTIAEAIEKKQTPQDTQAET